MSIERIFVAGHRGLVGGAVVRALRAAGHEGLITVDRRALDLTRQGEVEAFLRRERPSHVVVAAARVGGIHANATYPAEFIATNLQIATNLIDGAWRAGVGKLLFLGSSCIYPRLAPQPMTEDCLLTGPLEPTNQWYAVAKIAGIKLAQAYRRQYGCDFISAMPTNLYGPGDNFDPENGHVIPALIRRFHAARVAGDPVVTVWGSGQPRREFLHVDDVARACVHLLFNYSGEEIVNVGCGEDVSIRELAEAVKETVGYQGELVFDASKPDGAPRKLLDVSRLRGLGWSPRIPLRQGLAETYAWYLSSGLADTGAARVA